MQIVAHTTTHSQTTYKTTKETNTMAQFEYTNRKGQQYFLNSKVNLLNGNTEVRIFYFTRDAGRPEASELPDDREIVENESTGLPFVKRKQQ